MQFFSVLLVTGLLSLATAAPQGGSGTGAPYSCAPGTTRCVGNNIYVGDSSGRCQLNNRCNRCVMQNGQAYCVGAAAAAETRDATPIAVYAATRIEVRAPRGSCPAPGRTQCIGNDIYVGTSAGCTLNNKCNRCVEQNGQAYCV